MCIYKPDSKSKCLVLSVGKFYCCFVLRMIWFFHVSGNIFAGMFTYNKHAGVYWFSSVSREDYGEFNLVGVVSF